MGSTRNLSVQKSQFSILKETQNFDKQSITSKKKVDEKYTVPPPKQRSISLVQMVEEKKEKGKFDDS
jgi:hypothetical protein